MNDISNSAFVDGDIAQKHTIVELGKERDFLHMLMQNLDIGVAILDKDMRYRMLSNASFRHLKLNDGDIELGDPLSKMHDVMTEKGLMSPEIMAKNTLSEETHRTNVTTGTKTISRLVKLGDGTTHRFCRQILDNGYTISVASDVSELVEKDQLLDSALTLGRSGIWTYEFATKTYTLSKSLHSYFGKDLIDKIYSKGFTTIFVPEDRGIVKDALKNIAKTNDQFDVEIRAITRSGKPRWSRTTCELLRDSNGKPLRLRAFVKDTDREHRQQEQIEAAKDAAVHASKAKSEFLANMSHEIRTPMNGILGMAELLGMSNIDERQSEYVNVITNSASALLCIINDILDFSKIEAGAMHLDPTPFDLKSSINDVTALLITNAQEKGLELIINYPSDLPKNFIGDAGRVRQVLTNLVGNAIKFTAKGHVQIDVRVDASSENPDAPIVSLDVTDTGIGIAPDSLQAVFEKFTQADGSTTRVYGGTGLGLAITKRITEMMGGEINVTSEVGKGSTFSINFPLQIDKNVKEELLDIAVLSGKHALIVDDIAVNRTILTDQVAGWGMTSNAVSNGVEAADALRTAMATGAKPYDVILLDFLMPGVNGGELAAMLSKQTTVSVPPIVMLSSCDQPLTSEELRDIGIQTYLIKPVRERRLFSTLGRVISSGQTEEKAPEQLPESAPAPVKSVPATQQEFAPSAQAPTPSQPRPSAPKPSAPAPSAPAPSVQTAPAQPADPQQPKSPPSFAPIPNPSQYAPVQLMTDPEMAAQTTEQPSLDFATADTVVDTVSPVAEQAEDSELSLIDSMLADLSAATPVDTPAPKTQPSAPMAARTQPTAPPAPVIAAPEDTAVSPLEAPAKQEILVAEDFPLNRDVVRLMLVESAFEPVFAENGKLASDLYMAEPDRFPLVLMDVSMPVMDGFQATKAIRDWEAAQGRGDKGVPIIALTGHALKNDRQECLDAGMDHYLTKPVKQAELLETLEHYSGRAVTGAIKAA